MTGGPAAFSPGAGARGAGDQGRLRFAERMTAVEALMWRLGRRDARFGATMTLVVTVEGRISKGRLESRLAGLCRTVPRLRDRVRESPLGVAAPTWEADPTFDLGHHLEVGPGPLWDTASSVVASPFEEGRPPWRVALVRDGGPVGDAVVLHLHHSYTDGLGGMRLLGELFELGGGGADGGGSVREGSVREGSVQEDEAAEQPETGAPSDQLPPPGSFEALLLDVEEEIRRAMGLWSRALPWASRTLATARRDPGGLLHAAADLTTAVQNQLGAVMGPSSPVLSPRSSGVVLTSLQLDLEALRDLAHGAGATVNDVYLAGLLDGLERYHAKLGSVPPSLRLGMPISSRDSDTGMHNQLFGAVVRGPLGSLEFQERTRLVHEIVVQGRKVPLAPLVEDLAAATVRFPGGVSAVASVLAALDVLASNVVGPPIPMWLTGRPIESMTPFGPRSGSAVNATLLSYNGSARIGLNLDPASVPDPALLVDCVAAAFGDALAS